MLRNAHVAAGGLLAFVVVLSGACRANDDATPTVVTISADPALAESALDVATDFLRPAGLAVEPVAPGAEADVVVSGSASATGTPVVRRYWVPVVPLAHPATSLTMNELGGILSGRIDDWASIIDQGLPGRLLLANDPAPPVEQWWPGTDVDAEALSVDEIQVALAADAGALALLPLDSVDVGVRSLAVDGTNVVFGTGDVGSYPLVERVWVTHRGVESEEFGSLLDGLTAALAQDLALPPPEPIILRATGDIIPARCVYAKQRDYGDYRHAFLEVGPWLAEADIAVGSLDASISDAGEPFGCVETFSLLAPAASVDGLAFSGFDVMTVASNHVKDCGLYPCGDQAFFDTLANLRSAGIEPVGAGADLAEARRPAVVTVGGVRFAFLGYDAIAAYYHADVGVPGTAPLTEAFLREDVAAAQSQADVVVVLPQWGVEYTADPNSGQRALARAAIAAGADLVIGNHPHWVQAAEAIEDAFVAYALGNFVFDQDWSLETQQGVVLEAAFHGKDLKGIQYHPIRIVDQHQPVFAEPTDARQIMDRIWEASAALP